MEAGMGRALAIRRDFTAAELRRLARQSQDADQTRRLLALAVIYDGGSRGEAAETGGVGRQILRDWVERFNAEGPAGLIGRKPPGNRPKLDDAQRAALVRVVESGPNPVRDGVVRWRLIDLAAWVWGQVWHLGERGDPEPGTQCARLRQALRTATPLCPERGGNCRF
jgi:transposase